MSLEFRRLPLMEVHARLLAFPQVRFDLQTFALMHRAMPSNFSRVQALREFRSGPFAPTLTFQLGEPFGAEWSDPDSQVSIYFRPDSIEAIWLNGSTEPSDKYPRYNSLEKMIEDTLAAFEEASGETPSFTVANMTYTNLVLLGRQPRLEDVEQFLAPDFRVPHQGDVHTLHTCEVAWRRAIDEHMIDLRVAVQGFASGGAGAESDGFTLSTSCGIQCVEGEQSIDKLRMVHEELQGLFRDLISDHAKSEWEYVTD